MKACAWDTGFVGAAKVGQVQACGALQGRDRLKACVRESDTIARLGGDEFCALLLNAHDQEPVARVAAKMIEALRVPVALGEGRNGTVGASIGIALYPQHAADVDSLVKAADSAMYEIKRTGKNSFGFAP